MEKNLMIQLPSKEISNDDIDSIDQQLFQTSKLNTPKEIKYSELIQKTIQKNLHRYQVNENEVDKYLMNTLISNKRSHLNIIYDEMKLLLKQNSVLKRYYTMKESIPRLLNFGNYYKTYSKFLQNPTITQYLFNYLIHIAAKQKAQCYKNIHYGNKKKETENKEKEDEIIFDENIIETIENYSTTITCESKEQLVYPSEIYKALKPKTERMNINHTNKNNPILIENNVNNKHEKMQTEPNLQNEKKESKSSFSVSVILGNKPDEKSEFSNSLLSIMKNLKKKPKTKNNKNNVENKKIQEKKTEIKKLPDKLTSNKKPKENSIKKIIFNSKKSIEKSNKKMHSNNIQEKNEKQSNLIHEKGKSSNNIISSNVVKPFSIKFSIINDKQKCKKIEPNKIQTDRSRNLNNLKKSMINTHKIQISGLNQRNQKTILPSNTSLSHQKKGTESKILSKKKLGGSYINHIDLSKPSRIKNCIIENIDLFDSVDDEKDQCKDKKPKTKEQMLIKHKIDATKKIKKNNISKELSYNKINTNIINISKYITNNPIKKQRNSFKINGLTFISTGSILLSSRKEKENKSSNKLINKLVYSKLSFNNSSKKKTIINEKIKKMK